jgi:hypothetical protein
MPYCPYIYDCRWAKALAYPNMYAARYKLAIKEIKEWYCFDSYMDCPVYIARHIIHSME